MQTVETVQDCVANIVAVTHPTFYGHSDRGEVQGGRERIRHKIYDRILALCTR